MNDQAQVEALKTPTDLGNKARKEVAEGLNALLADTFALYIKCKNFHWHVSGPHFRSYHLLLDEQARNARLRSGLLFARAGGREIVWYPAPGAPEELARLALRNTDRLASGVGLARPRQRRALRHRPLADQAALLPARTHRMRTRS